MIETIKDISAIIGAILSAASLIALISKNARAFILDTISKASKADKKAEKEEVHTAVMDTANEIKELKEMLRKHIEEDAAFRKEVTESNKIALEFTKTECRSKIKNIFYRYEKQRVLPLYEKKTLMNIKELYIDTLHCNSYASFLLDEMDKWEVDYDAGHEIEDDASWTA